MSNRVEELVPGREWRGAIHRQGAPIPERHLDGGDGQVHEVAIEIEESVWLVRLGQPLRCHVSARSGQVAGRNGVCNGNLGLML
jgi:hypothetical protein